MRNLLLIAVLLGASSSAWAVEDEEEAGAGEAAETRAEADQPQARTLAERIPSVTRRAFRKEGRVELTPSLGLSMNDPFYDNYIVGAAVTYHVGESLAVQGSADFYLANASTIAVAGGGQPAQPDYNRLNYSARLELMWSPLYGKINLLAEHVLHFDTYVSLGPAFVGPSDTEASVAGTIAVGQHYFLSEWFAVRLELRDQVFMLARNPVVTEDKKLQNLLTFTVGACFYLPGEFEPEKL